LAFVLKLASLWSSSQTLAAVAGLTAPGFDPITPGLRVSHWLTRHWFGSVEARGSDEFLDHMAWLPTLLVQLDQPAVPLDG
jgi:hypothetical protein